MKNRLKSLYNVLAMGLAICYVVISLILLCVFVVICLAFYIPTFGKSEKLLDWANRKFINNNAGLNE